MIRIAIVEDDTGYRSQLRKYIDQYQSDFSETVSVSEFSDGLEIVEKYKSEYDIILMDIQMKHMDGMQAAMRIRDMDKNVIIIFITNSAQFAVQGYKVEALDYVLKPIQYFAFSQVLHNAVKKVHGKSKFYIHLIQESKMIRLDADQILYIESRGHTIIYHTEIGEYAEVTGSQDNRAMFVNYCEGIYVGYKFYETAAAEGLIDYDKVVQYPFGYGLSYTTFDSSIAAVEDDGEKITLDVAVKNTGDTAGKYVAEIFYEPPYYNGGIEKAAANLVQYAKTEILQPGEAQTLKITFRYEDMASYDSNGIKSANGAYVLEAGDYKINLCSDSHTILDTYVAKVDKDVIYDDAHDGARSTDQVAATNQLTFAQGDVTYLSRADGFANYAEATAAPANHSLSAQALADYASAATFDAAKYDDPNAVMPTTGANNRLKLADLTGVAYDDPKWEQLLDELTVNDLFSLTADGGYHTVGVESIGLSATEDCDGPTGVHSNYNPAAGPSYPGTVMLACTWNQPLAKARGEQIAKECAEINCTGWYAPAMNIHRSAFGGRNFEYYSECGVLSGLTAAAEVSGATENGLICYVKHFAFNDQDNYRQNNICTWLNEQSAREIYLKAFEQPIKAGGMGVMTSMNAVGPVWAGGCKALLTNILRDEWGFHGAVITDAVVSAWYMDGNLAIRTGGTKMLAFNITNEFYRDLNSVGTVTAMRNAAHGTLYALANSFAVTRAVSVPKWVKTTYAVDAVVAIILVAWEICAIRKYRKAKKEDEDTEQ